MADQEFKRNIAFKKRIGDLLIGKPIIQEDRFKYLELGNKNIVRVNLVANVVDKYDSEGDKTYTFLTLDDGSGQIKAKAFSDDVAKVKDLSQGQTILMIGVLRHFNNELYIAPEITRVLTPEYLLVRKKEIEQERAETAPPVTDNPKQVVAIKDKILEKIKNAETDGGIEIDQIIMNPEMQNTSPEIINQEVKKLIEEGIVFEPRPGKLRYLGS
jgi:DNA polymerase III alpha subunit